jgi:hypothetical protein
LVKSITRAASAARVFFLILAAVVVVFLFAVLQMDSIAVAPTVRCFAFA